MQSNSMNVCEICEKAIAPGTENTSRVCDECIARELKRETKEDELQQHTVCHKSFELKSDIKEEHEVTRSSERSCSFEICENKDVKTQNYTCMYIKQDYNEDLLMCTVCHKSFELTSDLKEHEASHSNERLCSSEIYEEDFKTQNDTCVYIKRDYSENENSFLCTVNNEDTFILENNLICNKRFASQLEQRESSCVNEKYECDICKKTFRTRDGVRRHILCMHEKRFTCKICHKRFGCRKYLKEHKAAHLHQRLHSCDKCGKSFNWRRTLLCHIKEIHGKLLMCTMCKKRFSFANELKHHESICVNKKYECDICKKTYRSKDCLRQHIRATHEEKRFTCNICHKIFACEQYLRHHKIAHVNQRLPCDECDKRFKSRRSLRCHVREMHVKLLMCTLCKKRFSFASELEQHESRCANENYQCNVCKKIFKTEALIKRHVRDMHVEKRFTCHICQKSFVSNSALKNHIPVHSREKPYPCDKCHKRFKSEYNLRYHARRMHTENPTSALHLGLLCR